MHPLVDGIEATVMDSWCWGGCDGDQVSDEAQDPSHVNQLRGSMVECFSESRGNLVSWTVATSDGRVELCCVFFMPAIRRASLSCFALNADTFVCVCVCSSLICSVIHYRGLKIKCEIFSAGTDASSLRLVSTGSLCVGACVAVLCCTCDCWCRPVGCRPVECNL